MTREEAIKRFETLLLHVDTDCVMGMEKTEAINMAIKALEQRWIPCSDRLPEKSGQYYVSGGGKVWICEFLIIPNFIGGWHNDAANPVVQAWMPLPKPYGGEQE